jgi:hypothetical protein
MGKHLIRIVLGGALALGLTIPIGMAGIATAAGRDDGDACHQRLQDAKAKIDHDAAKYGPDSSRVERDRAKMDQARQWCRDHHADWDHTQFDVGIYLRK